MLQSIQCKTSAHGKCRMVVCRCACHPDKEVERLVVRPRGNNRRVIASVSYDGKLLRCGPDAGYAEPAFFQLGGQTFVSFSEYFSRWLPSWMEIDEVYQISY